MKSEYILNKNYYIKDDLASLLLYFDYFSAGINLSKYTSINLIKKLIHSGLRLSVMVLYCLKIHKFFYEPVELDEDALIIVRGQGKWGSTVKLVKSNGKLKIIKKTFNTKNYLKEKKFYQTYKNNSSKIKLPEYLFLKDNTIEIEFLKCKIFQRGVNEGSVSFKSAIRHYNFIKEELKKFYKTEKTLIHRDTDLTNIFIKDSQYYLIDFTESRNDSYKYDFYNLLYAILYSFGYIANNEKSIINSKSKNINILNLLDINTQELKVIEKQFIDSRKKRFPGFYNQ